MPISAYIAPVAKFQYVDNTGAVVAGGKLFVYLAGTTTKATTYQDASLATPNANPVVLDSEGRATVFLLPGQFYDFVLSPSTDTDPPTNPIWTVSSVGIPGAGTPYALDTGVANAMVAANVVGLAPTRTSNQSILIKAAAAPTGPTTLAVTPAGGSSYGAIAIRDKAGAAIVSGLWAAGQVMLLTDDGTYWRTLF